MGKINLHVANANETFTADEISTFRKATKAAEEFILQSFDFDYGVDIVITTPFYQINAIPEDGISGRTYTSRFIIVVIDKQQAKITEDTVFETICHEMSHSLRWEKLPEYANTLFDGMILEGLGTVLEEKAMEDTNRHHKQHFLAQVQDTDRIMINDIIAQLKGRFSNEQYDYDKVFYTGDDALPRWAGYRLGYHMVKKYLETTGSTINEATIASYKDFKKALEI